MRFLVPFIGFRQITIPFKRDQRLVGTSSYTFLRLLKLGVSGLIAATSAPLVLVPLLSLVLAVVAGVGYFVMLNSSAVHVQRQVEAFLFWFATVANFVVMSVIACYLAAALNEVRARPLYIVSEVIGGEIRFDSEEKKVDCSEQRANTK